MSLLERLRAALDPDYVVEAPLAEGGMGLVFRAQDVQLQRAVAIKVLRPELATAAFRERFLREARTIAGFRHTHIVSVHRAGESDGLAWYAMDLLEGETLADRLAKGPMPVSEALHLADQILGALEAVHARGIVHRDIKPSNIFLAGGDAVVGDFGIAKSPSGELTALTRPGVAVGTPGYMPPEQATGGEVSTRTDVCAVGMLLYQMLTGRVWLFEAETKTEWVGMPRRLRPVLRRALAWDPRQRYPDAGALRRALAGKSVRRFTPVRAAVALAVVAAAVVIGYRTWAPPRPATAVVEIQGFGVLGGPSAYGDSLALEIVRALRAAPEITFRVGDGTAADVAVHVTGSLTLGGDLVQATLRGAGRRTAGAFSFTTAGTRDAIADSVARRLMEVIWRTEGGVLGAELPVHALPKTAPGVAAWATAELAYARAQWGAADTAYETALALDSTCIVCDFRLAEISRWLRQGLTTAQTGRLVAHVDSFPPAQQAIIRAWVDDPQERWTALDEIARRWPDYAVGLFTVGDEYFHRGPLVGDRREKALDPFRRATRLRPDFAPAWEHLAWVSIAEGNQREAGEALSRFAATASGNDLFSQILQKLIGDGYLWRFAPAVAAESTERFLASPGMASYPDLAQAPLYLMSFDAPEGVVWLGRRFVAWDGHPDLLVPGLVGQMMGLMALGRPAAARQAAARLRAQSGDAEYALAAGALEVALSLDDSLRSDSLHAGIVRTLQRLTTPGAATADERRRAVWLLAVAARSFGDAAGLQHWRAMLHDEPAPHALSAFLDAALTADGSRGAAGARRALALSAPLLALDSAGRAGEPLFRSVLHLARADWHLALGDTLPAVRDLRWHENQDVVGYSGLVMQAAEFDWALGTWARWRRARILGRELGTEEACRAYADVIRLWQGGEGIAARRAREAEALRAALPCREPS